MSPLEEEELPVVEMMSVPEADWLVLEPEPP